MTVSTCTIATPSGSEAFVCRSISGTERALAVVHLPDGRWSVTHRKSGFAVTFARSRESAEALGRLFWGALGERERLYMRGLRDGAQFGKVKGGIWSRAVADIQRVGRAVRRVAAMDWSAAQIKRAGWLYVGLAQYGPDPSSQRATEDIDKRRSDSALTQGV